MVGAASQVAHDVVDTPMSPNTLGPALHLETMAAALEHEFLRPTSRAWMRALVCAAGTLAWLLIAFVRRPSSRCSRLADQPRLISARLGWPTTISAFCSSPCRC